MRIVRSPTGQLNASVQQAESRCNNGEKKKDFQQRVKVFFNQVPRKGVEPSRLAAHTPQACASAISATEATKVNYTTPKSDVNPFAFVPDVL